MFFLSDMLNKKLQAAEAGARPCPVATEPIPTASKHFVSKRPLKGPYPEGLETAMFGIGCFWGAERLFWQMDGVWVTAVGYAGGVTPNPTYQETCTGLTGHAEVVLVVFDPKVVSYAELLKVVLGEPRPDPGHAPGQRCRHHLPLGDLHLRRRAASRPRSPRAMPIEASLRGGRPRQDHHRDRAGARILFRRGRPPAVSGQESRTAIAACRAPASPARFRGATAGA